MSIDVTVPGGTGDEPGFTAQRMPSHLLLSAGLMAQDDALFGVTRDQNGLIGNIFPVNPRRWNLIYNPRVATALSMGESNTHWTDDSGGYTTRETTTPYGMPDEPVCSAVIKAVVSPYVDGAYEYFDIESSEFAPYRAAFERQFGLDPDGTDAAGYMNVSWQAVSDDSKWLVQVVINNYTSAQQVASYALSTYSGWLTYRRRFTLYQDFRSIRVALTGALGVPPTGTAYLATVSAQPRSVADVYLEYFDGDTAGCSWLDVPHNSVSRGR